jgi:hypothetical protein
LSKDVEVHSEQTKNYFVGTNNEGTERFIWRIIAMDNVVDGLELDMAKKPNATRNFENVEGYDKELCILLNFDDATLLNIE